MTGARCKVPPHAMSSLLFLQSGAPFSVASMLDRPGYDEENLAMAKLLIALVALVAGLGAWGLSRVLPGGLVVLLIGVGGALLGALISTRRAEVRA